MPKFVLRFIENLHGRWQQRWILLWFAAGVSALVWGYSTTSQTGLDQAMLAVAIVGLVCVVALAFRHNLSGNGLGVVANIGEIFVQGRSGATGLMLAPLFYLMTHLYGLRHWAKHTDSNGQMMPRSASLLVWVITLSFIATGLAIFPWLNAQLQHYSFIASDDAIAFAGLGIKLTWYQINVLAFVLGVTAQTMMILRYAFSWWLWIIVNFVWLTVNIANNNVIFAVQTLIYQVNAFVGLSGWWISQTAKR